MSFEVWVLPVFASRDRRLPINFLKSCRIEREILDLSSDFPSHIEFCNVDSLEKRTFIRSN